MQASGVFLVALRLVDVRLGLQNGRHVVHHGAQVQLLAALLVMLWDAMRANIQPGLQANCTL